MQHLSAEYEAITDAASALLADETDLVANAANLSALLFERLDGVDWVGFFFVRGGELVLAPFQGRPTQTRLALGRGTAGRAVGDGRSIITDERLSDDSRDDDLAQAKIAVPLLLHARVIGILEISSPFAGRFVDADRRGLEAIARVFVDASDALALLPKRMGVDELRTATLPKAPLLEDLAVDEEKRSRSFGYLNELGSRARDVYDLPEHPAASVYGRTSLPARIAAAVLIVATLALTARFTNDIYAAAFFAQGPLCVGVVAIATLISICMKYGWHLSNLHALRNTAFVGVLIALARWLGDTHDGLFPSLAVLVAACIGGYLGAIIARALRRRSHDHHRVAELHRP